MAAYDYRCVSCEQIFELTRSLTDTAEVLCPFCGGATKRVFTPVGVVFKGSGFHNTDYRPKQNEEPSPAGKDSCASSGKSAACSTCPSAE